ncbi:hypothetical protein GF1_24670 [Desulfolithobacter dissulfuricans]|uniref:Uncharacterized protein n=1 Tax=Desulfolithobacter dissulfuricans TaxID=2795293 RepID=A0A915XLM7_9BACT|nr:hypothetical protein [Desulfolithobacter dissulfuricans]BCO10091.1 hypothetical protein GF1_24670 [Desulfolithobacter dissulfuricans]
MNKQFWANFALCVALLLLVITGVTRIGSALTPKGLLVSEPEPSAEAAPFMDKVTLVDYNLGEQQSNIVSAEFVLGNASEHDVRNIEILCEFFDRSGRYLDREPFLLSGILPAGKTMGHVSMTSRYVNSRAEALSCRLVDFELVTEPVFSLHRHEGGHGEAASGAAGHGGEETGHETGGGH